jgi:hypothetical protein
MEHTLHLNQEGHRSGGRVACVEMRNTGSILVQA